MKSKTLKIMILGGVIFSIFYAKHLVTLDAIENVDVSYTKESSETPGEVLMFKDGVSFGQNEEEDIPLYISQESLEEVPEDLVIEVADPTEKTLTPPPDLKTENKKPDNPFVSNKNSDNKKEETKKTSSNKSSSTTTKKEENKTKEEPKKEQAKPTTPVVVAPTETKSEVKQEVSVEKPQEKPVETPKVEEPVVVAPPVVEPVVPTQPAEPAKPVVEANKFSDIVFIGDSIMEGLSIYTVGNDTVLKDATFIYKNGVSSYNLLNGTISFNGVEQNLVDALVATGKKDFCISLGTNDLVSFNVEQSVDNLFQLCSNIKAKIPDAKITLISTTYVADGKVKGNLSTPNVLMYNYKVKKNASRYDYGYINWAHLINDDYGNLAAKYTTDGFVHLNNDAYKIYTDTLINH